MNRIVSKIYVEERKDEYTTIQSEFLTKPAKDRKYEDTTEPGNF